MLQQPLRVEIFEIFGKGGGGNLIWGDLAFYGGGGDFRNHGFENIISHGTPKFIIWENI